MIKQYHAMLLVDRLLIIVSFIFLIYLSIIWSLSIIVAVTKPCCHGTGVVG